MPAQRDREPDRSAPPPGAVERLYVMYFAGVLLLMLAIVLVALYAAARLERLSAYHAQVFERLNLLQGELERISALTAPAARDAHGAPESGRRPERPPATLPARTNPAERAELPAGLPDSDAVVRAFGAVVAPDPVAATYRLTDRRRGEELLGSAARSADPGIWDGRALVCLAMLARLAGDEPAARRYAAAARQAGHDTSAYDELSARELLAQGRPAEAALFASSLSARPERRGVGAVLSAAAHAQRNNPTGVREALAALQTFDELPPIDRLTAGRLFEALEQWRRLAQAVEGLENLPEELALERDYLRGVGLIAEGKYVEAVAVLDFVRDKRPDDYGALTWRGVALMRARQTEAARAALARAAERDPGRPEAWYHAGILEINAGDAARGVHFLNKALAASAAYAPAWEALASVALNDGDADAALEYARRAVESDRGRASAHFLEALGWARAARREPCAAALRACFALDPGFIEEAAGTEVIARLFDRVELEALRDGATYQAAPTTVPSGP